MTTEKRTAYTLLELIVIMMIVTAVAFMAIPRLQFAALRRQQADTVARKIVTDLRRTRSLAIADAANNKRGFELSMVGSEPYSGYKITNRDTMAVVEAYSVDSNVSVRCTGWHTFRFGPLGDRLTGSGSLITVAAEGRTFTITIVPATGAVKCVKN